VVGLINHLARSFYCGKSEIKKLQKMFETREDNYDKVMTLFADNSILILQNNLDDPA
jgi:hypothetical protein